MFYGSKIPEDLPWNPNSAKYAPQSTQSNEFLREDARPEQKSRRHTFANGASNKYVGKH